MPEEHGGSGYGLEELVVVVEQLGRAVAPGAFVPTVVASAVLAAAAPDDVAATLLPGLADGSTCGAVALGGDVELRDGALHGSAGAVIGAGLADVLLVGVGDDVAVVDARGRRRVGRDAAEPRPDAPLRAGALRRRCRPPCCPAPARRSSTSPARSSPPRPSASPASAPSQAAQYAKEREQFGRPIAMFQAVKHHCANMLVATELATAAVWDAARAASAGGDQFSLTAAMAAALAMPAADLCANLNIQVHGGIGFTWEHDAHLYLRRAAALGAIVDAEEAAVGGDRPHQGRRPPRPIGRPAAGGRVRPRRPCGRFADSIAGLDEAAQRASSSSPAT